MRTRKSVRAVLAAGVAGLAVTGALAMTTQAAAAAEVAAPTHSAEATAAIAATAAERQAAKPNVKPVKPDVASNKSDVESAVVAEQNEVQVSVGELGDASVTLTSGGKQLRLSLPNINAPDTVRTADGAQVRLGAQATDLVVAEQSGGVQVMAVMHDSSAPTTQRYQIAGAQLHAQSDGSILVNTADGQIGRVAAPWARDANGKDLQTRYVIDGDTFVQSTDTAGAAYPVVADPTVSLGWYIYVRYSKSEVQSWGTKIGALGYKYVLPGMCSLVPHPAAAIACGAALGVYGNSIGDTILNARNNNQCFEFRFNYAPVTIVGWRNYNC